MTTTLTHRCGHQATHELQGRNHRARRWEQAELASALCPDCQTQRDAERKAAADAAAAAAEAAGLPALEGTPRQVAWALKVRDEQVARVRSVLEETRRAVAGATEPWAQDWLREMEAYADELCRETRAGWWLDHRHVGVVAQLHAHGRKLRDRYEVAAAQA